MTLAPLLTSCAGTGQETSQPRTIDTSCDWVTYIYISRQDSLTDGTARQILAHNEALQARCEKGIDKPG
ncbi:hypothetical protein PHOOPHIGHTERS_58 [Serratia phage vB_SmaS_PhooPhighters]|nr:hypothetical protein PHOOPHIGHTERS_58 [Serratia phage vB_SmaS_PhooPhighters]